MNLRFVARQLRVACSRDVVLMASLLGAMLVGFVAYVARVNSVTPDAFHEMSLVREWFRTGNFPTNDVWAYTSTVRPTVHHEWATGLALYWSSAASPLGPHGMMALRWCLIAAIWLVLYRVARNAGCHPILFALLAPVTFPFLWVGFGTVRAQLFTLLFLALQMLMLQADWRGKKSWTLAWIVMFLVWLNMHAGFIVGAALLIWHIVERVIHFLSTRRVIDANQPWNLRRIDGANFRFSELMRSLGHLFALVPIGVGLTLLNPWGIDYWWYLARAIAMPRPTITEWKPLWYTHAPVTTMLAFLVAVALIFYGMSGKPWQRWRLVPFCILAAFLSLQHIRHGSLFGILWIGVVPAMISAMPLGKAIIQFVVGRRCEVITVACLAASICGAFACTQPFWMIQLPTRLSDGKTAYPVGAVQYLENHRFEGKLMTPFAAGAFVSWKLYPNVQVSLDGRYEVAYPAEVLPDHERIYDAKPGWKQLLPNYASDLILVHRMDPLAAIIVRNARMEGTQDLPSLPGWRLCYIDDTYLLIGRMDSALPFEDARRMRRTSESLAGLESPLAFKQSIP